MTAAPGALELNRPPAEVARVRGRLDASWFLVAYVALLLLIPSQLVFPPLGAAGTPAALWGMGGLVWWMAARAGRFVRWEPSPVRLALFVFALGVGTSYAVAMARGWYAPVNVHQATDNLYDLIPPTAQQLRTTMMSAADRGLLALAGWTGVVVVTLDGLRTWKDLDRVVTWMVRFGTAVAVLGIVQFFTGFDVASYIHVPGLRANAEIFGTIDRSVLRRANATAIHPIEFGVVMGGIFPLALHRAIGRHGRVLGWVPTSLIVSASLMSVSRSAALVVGIAMVVLIASWPSVWRGRALVAIPLATVALRVLVPGLVGTMRSLWLNLFADPSTTGRTSDYGIVFNLIGQTPVFGRGMFTFVPRYYRTLDNQLLITLIETGIVGFIALSGLFGAAYFCARGARRRLSLRGPGHLGTALSAAVLGVYASFATFDALAFPMAAGLSFLLIGLSGAVWQIANRQMAQ